MGKIAIKKKAITTVLSCFFVIVFLMTVLPIFVTQTNAVMPVDIYMGKVTGKNNDVLTVQIEYKLDYSNPHNWVSYSATSQWTISNSNAINEMRVGDYIEIAGLLGVDNEGESICIGKMKSSTEKVITDVYGDPDYLVPVHAFIEHPGVLNPPLLGDYIITYENIPDCSKYHGIGISGCNVEAKYSDVTIRKENSQLKSQRLYPSQNYVYEDEEYNIDITFNSGEAPAYPDCTDQPCFGPQAFSDFTIHIKKIEEKKPDLIIQGISWSPSNPKQGDTVTINIITKNKGSGNAGGFDVCYYADGSYYDRDYVSSLSAGSTTTTSFTWTAKCGSHAIKAVADCYNAVAESNEENNWMSKGGLNIPCKPDLRIPSITWDKDSPKRDDTIAFTVKIKNRGDGNAGTSTVKYYIDVSYVDSDTVPSLSVGSNSTQTFTWTANKCGDVQVKAVADATNAVDEGSNEGNNERTETVSVICLFYIRPACQDVNGNHLDGVSYEFVDYPAYKGTCDYNEYLIASGHGTYKVKFTKGDLEATVTLESHSKPFAGTVVTLRKKEAHLEKIWITGPTEIKAGEAFQWKAYGSYSDGSQKELTSQVSWTVDALEVLQNVGNGKFKGLKGGEATIKITYEGKSASKKVTVIEKENQPPKANFTYEKDGLTVHFTSTSDDPDGDIETYSWFFGDGGTSNQKNPTHTYSTEGTYTVVLLIRDEKGLPGSYSEDISVTEKKPTEDYSLIDSEHAFFRTDEYAEVSIYTTQESDDIINVYVELNSIKLVIDKETEKPTDTYFAEGFESGVISVLADEEATILWEDAKLLVRGEDFGIGKSPRDLPYQGDPSIEQPTRKVYDDITILGYEYKGGNITPAFYYKYRGEMPYTEWKNGYMLKSPGEVFGSFIPYIGALFTIKDILEHLAPESGADIRLLDKPPASIAEENYDIVVKAWQGPELVFHGSLDFDAVVMIVPIKILPDKIHNIYIEGKAAPKASTKDIVFTKSFLINEQKGKSYASPVTANEPKYIDIRKEIGAIKILDKQIVEGEDYKALFTIMSVTSHEDPLTKYILVEVTQLPTTEKTKLMEKGAVSIALDERARVDVSNIITMSYNAGDFVCEPPLAPVCYPEMYFLIEDLNDDTIRLVSDILPFFSKEWGYICGLVNTAEDLQNLYGMDSKDVREAYSNNALKDTYEKAWCEKYWIIKKWQRDVVTLIPMRLYSKDDTEVVVRAMVEFFNGDQLVYAKKLDLA